MVRTHMHVIPSYGDFLNMLPFNSAIQDARALCCNGDQTSCVSANGDESDESDESCDKER